MHAISNEVSHSGYLDGQLLVAMPGMPDSRFQRTVIYMCAHSDRGALGIVVNKLAENIAFGELMEQLDIAAEQITTNIPIHVGGPVETGKGFVLHSGDYSHQTTLTVNDDFGLTATVDILKEIAGGGGPKRRLLALGYSSWGPGQLDQEIQANGWLHVPADFGLVFDSDIDAIWASAVAKLGVDISFLSAEAGHA